LNLTEVIYDHEKTQAAKQAAKITEILAIEAYKKTHSQKLTQGSQFYVNITTAGHIKQCF